MNVRSLLRTPATITRTRPGTARDVFGDAVAVTHRLDVRCWLWQTVRGEQTANADTQEQTWHVGLAAADGAPLATLAGLITGSDRLTVDGTVYEFDGPPWEARNPRTGRLDYLEATVRRVA